MAVGGGTITTITTTSDATINGLTVGKGAGAVSNNTAVGVGVLQANSSGGSSAGVGYQALYSATSGAHAALGQQALYSNTSGTYNSAVGYQAGYSNTTGANNVAIGAESLRSNTTASNNTAVGYQAGYTNSTGESQVFIGLRAGRGVTTGTENVFIGADSGYATTTGSYNVTVGKQALRFNTTASNNTAVGYQAGYTNTTSSFNTIFGAQAGYLFTNAGDGFNTFLGRQAGYNTTGTNNTFVGDGSAYLVTTGSKNTVVGIFTGNQGGLDIRTASNYIVLSDGDGNPRCYWTNNGVMVQSSGYTDNFISVIRNSTATRPYGLYINFSAATPNNTTENFLNCADSTNEKCIIFSSGTVTNRTGTYNAFSDIKLKQDVVDAGSQWDDIKAVRVRKFRLKDDVVANPEAKPLIGVIAQELELTSAGLIDDCVDKEGDVTKSVKYSILYMKAVKALQEAMERIEQLEARLDAANL
jgi:hypothetical protein